ncbi:uncharacterized protein SPPG_07380 [Spizellomyces punctatus DAOM BR117]|uniref:RRM domain-containing protein n=1 Tax=Spizellomyces punctatus (strain DAOM BR117) TaxID=645134 RepID=A0A0L0H9X7_SPIPD|nr:uncharacterized protein SPPG_07380 [Spizellomyces punctatus DAOM BR117]KNC97463.1 hypothetical protein SPPG_07380 [Spizellomyces punctatus DAOM BR117]|eukprot:XP_016605503.1 hypothetical protein SPPG_07380 [Spizellomyces punctatus DAOM BR117]
MASDEISGAPKVTTDHENGTSPSSGEKRKRQTSWDNEPGTDSQPSPKNARTDGATFSEPTTPAAANPTRTQPSTPQSQPSIHPTSTSLTAEQRERLEKAKAFAREATLKILQSKLAQTPLVIPNAASLAAGVEARSIAVMSRIYVGSINFELTEQHIKAVFNQFGYVKSVSMTIDPATGKHKGFCFVEYEVPEAAELALDLMNGAELGGRQLKVGRPNNYNPTVAKTLPTPIPQRLYIANVNEFVSEQNIESIFEAFGKIKGCSLLPDLVQRKHKGNGYIEFEEETAAIAALASMNNFELGGQPLRMMKAMIGGPLPPGMKSLETMPPVPVVATVPASVLNVAHNINNTIAQKTGAAAAARLINPALQSALAKVQARVNEENAALEENMSISASQRYSIMQKLMRSDGSQEASSPVIALRNMVVVKDLDDSLNDEISEECTKYGRVLKVLIWVDPVKQASDALKPDDNVDIYVQFEAPEAARQARAALDKRFFAGRRVAASFFTMEEFAKLDSQTNATI